jgi:hypothetical protein
MAEWKKIIVSGSDISQLNNDAGYLASTGTIDSASVAARATTLSPDATASFADLASDARTADSASVAARATLLSVDATASFADLASNARTADSASVAARATTLSADATASIADRATTASFAESGDGLFSGSFSGSFEGDGSGLTGLATSLTVDGDTGTEDVDLVNDDLQIIGTSEEIETAVTKVGNDVRVTLGLPDSITVTASLATNAENAQSASVAARATELSADATASFADLASNARTADSASVAARATELSADATASFADRATSASIADDIKDGAVTNAKLVNDSITLGTTEITLGTTVGTLSGLDAISATTGTFVLQVYESSSTIITSGSNIFGNDQNDIQQITGSLKQSGSFTLSGSLLQSNGTISGSFEGDGSALTGIIADSADSASVAARATTLSADATASFADLASDARTADSASVAARATELSADATASFADLASDARTADSASVAARATTLSADATASHALTAVTASHALNVPATASHALTAVTASIADELSGLATASIADTATTASHAITAVSASATVAGVLFPVADGITNQALVTDGAGQFTYGDIFGTGSTKKLNQSVAAATWSFQHDLNELYPIVQVYDSTGDQLIPERVESIDVNNVKLYFATDTAGVAAAMVGGMGISASNATRATSASQADNATTASHALGGAGDFSGSFEGDGSGLTGVASDFNFQGDTGATTISLTTETASFVGTANEIVTAVTDNTLTISLPDDVTIGNNLTVTNDATIAGDLVVGGSIVSASSLAVEDQFIILASGSNGAIDGGIIVNQVDDDPDGKGKAFAYDSSANRWALESNLNDTASVITPDAFMGVIQEGTSTPVGGADPIYGGTNGNGTIFVDTNNNEAYIYI